MSINYLLDTNIISETLRPKPNPKILTHLKRHQDEIAIPAVVWHELWYGAKRLDASKKQEAIETYLTQVLEPTIPILPYDEQAALWHALERARLTRQGKTPPFADGQIAAIAHANDLILVTHNRSDYTWFQDLKLESWV